MRLFTSESVTEGHPDKMCDKIADSILDELIKQDKFSRVACEVAATTGIVLIMGEITTKSRIDINKVARKTIKNIGYTDSSGFSADNCGIFVTIGEQSQEIASAVNTSLECKASKASENCIGAGDQGLMFGFATNETKNFMPAPIFYAHKLAKQLADIRKNKVLPFLMPDGKTQVTLLYDENKKVVGVDTIVISTQHKENIKEEELKESVIKYIIEPIIPKELLLEITKYFINPAGKFIEGGPKSDTGLTGRKIMVDTYGGFGRHGGGAFSGKDPTKVDRSGAYFARFIAKNIVANNLADVCELQIAYAIGVAKPVSVTIDTFNTAKVDERLISSLIMEKFDMRPQAIIERLNLLRPIYSITSTYGHFGREDGFSGDFPWEEIIEI